MKHAALTFDDAVAIGRLDAHDQAQLVRNGELSALDLTEAAIQRIERLDPKIGAVSYRAFETARERARGVHAQSACAFAGVPYLIKDSLEYPGMPARAGSRSRDDTPSTSMYPFIERYERAGLIPVGKSSMCEFGLMGTTEPLRYGPTRNPWALDRSAGGSSGGATAAVAAGLVPLAHASDAAGSIRVPAASCGVFGFKPSRDLNVRARAQNLIDDVLCSDSLISRSVRDAEWAFNTARPDRAVAQDGQRRLRIAVILEGLDGSGPEPVVGEAISRTADLCRRLGHRISDARLSIGGAAFVEDFKTLWGYLGNEVVDSVRRSARGRPLEELLEPFTLSLGAWGRHLTGTHLEAAFARLVQAQQALAQFFKSFDIVLSPVASGPATVLGRLAPTQPFETLMQDMFSYMNYTPLQNLAGTPAMSVPLFTGADGLPIGSMFAAARGQDDLLFALAYELEQAQPWKDRWPTLP